MMRARLSMTLALVASLLAPGVVAAQTIAIVGGKVYPVSAPPIENGTVLIRDGRIVAVGSSVTIPAGAHAGTNSIKVLGQTSKLKKAARFDTT